MGTNTPAHVHRNCSLDRIRRPGSRRCIEKIGITLVILASMVQTTHAICGEAEECQAMGQNRREMLKGHIAATKDMVSAKQCNHILVAHALHYEPTGNCPEADALHAHLTKTCIQKDLTQLLPHAPLCQTRAQHTLGALLTLHIVAVVTTAVAAEWLHGKT